MQLRFDGDERSVLIARFGLPGTVTDTEIGDAVQRHLLAAESPPNPDPQPPADPPTAPATTPSGPQGPTVPGGDPGSQGAGGNDGGNTPPDAATNPEEDDSALEGMTVLDNAAFAELQARAAMADRLKEEDRVRRRDELVAAAVKAGKFPPSRRDHYAALFDSDPEGTERMIKRLHGNVVPLEARGVEPSEVEANPDAYPQEWLPETAATAGSNGAGKQTRQSRVTTED
jgi:hypothetical protein